MNPADHSWWLLSRSAGVVALVLVAVATLIGLALAAGHGGPPARRVKLVAFHEQTANAALAAIGLHGVTLLGDSFLRPSLLDIAIPLTIDYKPAFVATGILGGYLAALLGLSFYARKRVGAKRWRKAHRATPLVYVLGLVHTLGAGTDAGSSWLRAFMLATAFPAVLLLAASVRKARLKRSPKAGKISVTPTEI
jgi:sulfoxide reductase heme-binding subunit YedZ